MRTARIGNVIYPIGTLREVLFAIKALDDASEGFRLSPTIFDKIRYKSEGPVLQEDWQTPRELERTCIGDCEDIANYLTQLLRQLGQIAHVGVLELPTYLHAVTFCNGLLLDACPNKGMPVEPNYAALARARGIIFL